MRPHDKMFCSFCGAFRNELDEFCRGCHSPNSGGSARPVSIHGSGQPRATNPILIQPKLQYRLQLCVGDPRPLLGKVSADDLHAQARALQCYLQALGLYHAPIGFKLMDLPSPQKGDYLGKIEDYFSGMLPVWQFQNACRQVASNASFDVTTAKPQTFAELRRTAEKLLPGSLVVDPRSGQPLKTLNGARACLALPGAVHMEFVHQADRDHITEYELTNEDLQTEDEKKPWRDNLALARERHKATLPCHRVKAERQLFSRETNPMIGVIPIVVWVQSRENAGSGWKPACQTRVTIDLIAPCPSEDKALQQLLEEFGADGRALEYVMTWSMAEGSDPIEWFNCAAKLGGKRGDGGAQYFLSQPPDAWSKVLKCERTSIEVQTDEDGRATVGFLPSIQGGDVFRLRAFVERPDTPPGFDHQPAEWSQADQPAMSGPLVVMRRLQLGPIYYLPDHSGCLNTARSGASLADNTLDFKILADELRKAFFLVDDTFLHKLPLPPELHRKAHSAVMMRLDAKQDGNKGELWNLRRLILDPDQKNPYPMCLMPWQKFNEDPGKVTTYQDEIEQKPATPIGSLVDFYEYMGAIFQDYLRFFNFYVSGPGLHVVRALSPSSMRDGKLDGKLDYPTHWFEVKLPSQERLDTPARKSAIFKLPQAQGSVGEAMRSLIAASATVPRGEAVKQLGDQFVFQKTNEAEVKDGQATWKDPSGATVALGGAVIPGAVVITILGTTSELDDVHGNLVFDDGQGNIAHPLVQNARVNYTTGQLTWSGLSPSPFAPPDDADPDNSVELAVYAVKQSAAQALQQANFKIRGQVWPAKTEKDRPESEDGWVQSAIDGNLPLGRFFDWVGQQLVATHNCGFKLNHKTFNFEQSCAVFPLLGGDDVKRQSLLIQAHDGQQWVDVLRLELNGETAYNYGISPGGRGTWLFYDEQRYDPQYNKLTSSNLTQTTLHELGHNLFLRHQWTHPERQLGTRDSYEDHDGETLCLMGYRKTKLYFCGKCLLHLRGWNINEIEYNYPK